MAKSCQRFACRSHPTPPAPFPNTQRPRRTSTDVRAAAELSADSANATPTSATLTTGPDAAAVGIETTRVASSSASRPSTGGDPARACSCRIRAKATPQEPKVAARVSSRPPRWRCGELQQVSPQRTCARRRPPRSQPEQRPRGLLVAPRAKQRGGGCPGQRGEPVDGDPADRLRTGCPASDRPATAGTGARSSPNLNVSDAATPAMIAWSTCSGRCRIRCDGAAACRRQRSALPSDAAGRPDGDGEGDGVVAPQAQP